MGLMGLYDVKVCHKFSTFYETCNVSVCLVLQ